MKVFVVALLLVPLVHCFLLDDFAHIFDVSELKSVVQKIADNIGSDASEAACEKECTVILHSNALLSSGCDLVCRSFQSLVTRFHVA
uniref:Developmentally-regulated vdg3 n=1 Tax=Haliotis asinina TaxID=109174 RepID=Q5D218_HALAI|nr:developmentally-regulated vdg3 [Haliotis asinina]